MANVTATVQPWLGKRTVLLLQAQGIQLRLHSPHTCCLSIRLFLPLTQLRRVLVQCALILLASCILLLLQQPA